MGRTRLFSILGRALAESAPPQGPRALTRRQALQLAAAAALAACTPGGASAGNVAIIGGGVAGLTIAYRLARAGRKATLYEASRRFGGRMFTKRNFNAEGMFCELGGELVDSNHKPLMALAEELGVGIERLKPENDPAENIYAIGRLTHSQHEMLHDGAGAFAPIAKVIATDRAALTGPDDSWTDKARALDRVSVKAYLQQFRGLAPDWAIDLLDLAYWGEYGLPTEQQSALNLVDFIGSDPAGEFRLFGDSDEAFRIAGGSSTLTDALLARLGPNIELKAGHALIGLATTEHGLRLAFDGPKGRLEAAHDRIALALPFTKLREVNGLDAVGFSPEKLRAIRELGYGDNAKLMIGTTSRPWTSAAAGLPVASDGEFYSDVFQVVWDTSRGQAGTRGILTNYLTGVDDQAVALAHLQSGLRALSPAIAASLDTGNLAAFFWARHPFTKGSFAGAKLGQYTTLLEVAPMPELGGRVQFAGEHTSADYLGFMCGGVASGERAAAALLARI
jgi:monoamine oxidase